MKLYFSTNKHLPCGKKSEDNIVGIVQDFLSIYVSDNRMESFLR
ncbi:MAG: hypothetical protein OXM55_04325 [Bdellovibrionales bacterium]|nr:hypothetical protein [Bdellovibrionales bacterium]